MSPTHFQSVTSTQTSTPAVRHSKRLARNNNMTTSGSSAIDEVRDAVLQDAASHPNDFYECDLSRVRSSDWQVKRFIVKARATSGEKNAVCKATEDLIQNMMWRKEVRIYERTEDTFPVDFFRAGLIGFADCPQTGNNVIYINTKVYRKVPELTDHFFAFGHTFLDRLDREAKGQRFTLFLDLSDMELANADVHFMRYYLELMSYRFPMLLERTILFEPPWYIKPVISVVLKVFPKTILKNVSLLDRKTAIQELTEEGIPEGAGGRLCTDIPVPPNAPSYIQYAETHGIPIQAMERARREYNLT